LRSRGAPRAGIRLGAGLCLLLAALPAQEKKDDEIRNLGPDPYTEREPKAMAALGIVSYGPFPLADDKSSTDVDRVLGEKRILWAETAHFRIGSSLASQVVPQEPEKRRAILEDLAALHKKLAKVPEKPHKIDPWLRLHIFAQRAESCYAAFEKLVGATDADFGDGTEQGKGHYLGLPDKFVLMLFQKKSDLARYMDRFCNVKTDGPYRYFHSKSSTMLVVLCVEGVESFDDAALHRYMVYLLTNNFLCGYQGFFYTLPLWFQEGLAHWYSRKVESDFVVANIKDDDAVEQEKQNEWPRKVRRRAQFEATCIPFATMVAWQKWEELGFHSHTQAWSRIDFLMSRGPEKLGQMVKALKSLSSGVALDKATVDAAAAKELQERFGLDDKAFDQQWREWVLKTYPKK
jgi:hypothetical protein